MKVLNNRDARKVLAPVEEHWGADLSGLLKEHSLVLTEKGKVYIVRRDVFGVPVDARINTLGMYFANVRDSTTRLSMEGAALVVNNATRNVIRITDDQAYDWIRGRELEVDDDAFGYQIVMRGEECLGCGYAKKGTLLNFVPKVRRIYAE